jgi:hypothetical protein
MDKHRHEYPPVTAGYLAFENICLICDIILLAGRLVKSPQYVIIQEREGADR